MIYIILPTLFENRGVRYQICIDIIEKIKKTNYIGIIVDNSIKDIHDEFMKKTCDNIIILKQTVKDQKFGAIKRALRYIQDVSNNNEDIICFQEPEKDGMFDHLETILKFMKEKGECVCVPSRIKELVRSSTIIRACSGK